MPLIAPPPGPPIARREKRALAAIGVAIVALFAGVGAWSASDSWRSHAGCVTVTFPSSTGGALVHECGARAQVLCRHAFRHDDRLSLLTRPQCRQAGLS
ncbi:MAG TPA: hypothetical protein VN840_10055 [Streptosporangiaceae bacterium]|nr:hypothetical protein [Streptosporangiaceae bacterium]